MREVSLVRLQLLILGKCTRGGEMCKLSASEQVQRYRRLLLTYARVLFLCCCSLVRMLNLFKLFQLWTRACTLVRYLVYVCPAWVLLCVARKG